MILAQYSKNSREFKDIFYLTVTDQSRNISSKLCYHARFSLPQIQQRVSKDERYAFPYFSSSGSD